MKEQFNAIPQELRELEQWVVAAPDKRPWSTAGVPASSTDPSTWTDFYSACTVAESWGAGVGFMLHPEDGLACIDLDVKDAESHPGKPEVWTTAAELEFYQALISKFDSYTERSRSGKGFHVWVRGDIGAGARRGGLEVYSQERFIICTGDVYLDKPVAERQELLAGLVERVRSMQGTPAQVLEELEAVLTDEVILQRATTATNADKFNSLWAGVWEGEYPSQSEADLSLMSMLTFYSKSNEQCRRLFRMSALGKREKAVKNNYYLDNTLKVIRGRQATEQVNDETIRASFERLMGQQAAPQPAPVNHSAGAQYEQQVVHAVQQSEFKKELPGNPTGSIPWPPGRAGEIARWLYDQAPRPVREIAIVSTLGLLAGVGGRVYNINGSGLNLYVVLVAKSAIGKEAMHTGLSKLVSICAGAEPKMTNYVDFADYASGPALVKSLSTRTSFVNVAGEWGRKLRKMSDDNTEGPMSGLRTVMTNLYQKSGKGTVVGGIGYSDKEKDVKSVDGVAFSLIGETTPDTFYESLTNTMMQDGFMSRFIVIEYSGLRPELRIDAGTPMPAHLVETIAQMARNAEGVAGYTHDVPTLPDAAELLDSFNKHCDIQINSTDDESWRQMWNRAHLKALKISALLAVADNCGEPFVAKHHAEWALDLIYRDINIMSRKITDGDVGNDDQSRQKKIMAILRDYLRKAPANSYRIIEAMRVQGYVPRSFLQMKTQKVNSFAKFRLGQNEALDKTMRSLADSGYVAEIPAGKLPPEYGFQGKTYRIVNLPDYV